MSTSTTPATIFRTLAEYRTWRQEARKNNQSVGFVPTMGALHEGHLSLVRRSLAENDLTVVSIFVNPAQFAPHEDLATYPRTLPQDLEMLNKLVISERTTSAVFVPTVHEMYPSGIDQNTTLQKGTFVEVKGYGTVMEGASRPSFFRGVATVVTKLFNAIEPSNAYFGQKDIQQGLLLKRMSRDLLLSHPTPETLHIIPTARDPSDNLALSSRNAYLSSEERKVAPVLHAALLAAKEAWNSSDCKQECLRKAESLISKVQAESEGVEMKLDYIQFNHWQSFDVIPAEATCQSLAEGEPVILSGAIRFSVVAARLSFMEATTSSSTTPTTNPASTSTLATTTDKLEISPSLLQSSTDLDAIGLKSRPASPQLTQPSPIQSRPAADVLNEFDPLENSAEREARQAWDDVQGNPPQPAPSPPPRTPSPPSQETNVPPMLSLKDTATNEDISATNDFTDPSKADSPSAPSASLSAFPTLSALARTFSIPTPLRARPLSMDSAKPVPSPGTLSSFAAQQEAARSSTDVTEKQQTPEDLPAKDASGRNTPNYLAGPSGFSSERETSPSGTLSGETPFDFQKFLDQMKSRSAEPVAKYLRSFLSNFAKRTFTVGDQVKIINDFLNFIAPRMREADIWKHASDAEFDNAMEGMEKLVMNRLYDFTFTPQIARSEPRRPVTSDDLEKDRILSQRIRLFGWIEEKHLDIPVGEGSKGFLMFAQQELLKINHYKAPRDKLICILNCCKVIFGLIRHLKKEEGADSFVPILIYAVLKANPEHLISNVEFINRFRNPEKLQSEAGYYLSSLMGAVSFIETMDHSSLSNITQEEFERNVEEAILNMPEPRPESPAPTPSSASIPASTSKYLSALGSQSPHMRSHSHPSSPSLPTQQSTSHIGEESAQPLSLPTPSISQTNPAQTLSEDARRLLQKTGDTISKPLNAIGRIFSEALDGAESKLTYLPGPFAPFELARERENAEQVPSTHWSHPNQIAQHDPSSRQVPQTPMGYSDPNMAPVQTPYKPRVRKTHSPYQSNPNSPDRSPRMGYASTPEDTPTRYGPSGSLPYTNSPLAMGPSQSLLPPRVQSLAQPEFGITLGGSGPDSAHVSRTPTPALDLTAVQEQIDSATEQAAAASKATLMQIFPSVDTEVVEWVLEANEGDLGKSIEALLEMSSGT